MSLYQSRWDGDADALRGYLARSENAAVRRRAATALGQLDDDDHRTIEALVNAARDDEDPRVRAAAIDALDERGRDAVEHFISTLVEDDVSTAGADWASVGTFVPMLDAPEPEVRMAAATVLGHLEESRVLPALLPRLRDDDARVRTRVARACGRLEDPRAVNALAGRFADPDANVRRASANALAVIGTRPALTALIDSLDDDSESVRYAAAAALSEFGDVRPVSALADALSDESALVRRAAAFSIVELLSLATHDQSHRVREAVVDRLSKTVDAGITDALIELVESGRQAAHRRNAAWLLGRVLDEEREAVAIDALVGTLAATDQPLVSIAATSLVEIGGNRVETALIDVIDDSSTPVSARAKAIFVLGSVGGERTRERLDTLVDEADDDEVRKQAFAALSKLGGRGHQP